MNGRSVSNAGGGAERGVHVIRLRGPWEYRVLSGGSASRQEAFPQTGRMRMPADWGDALGADFRGRVEFSRRFARPTGLVSDQRVDLVLDGVDARARVLLNDAHLLEIPPGGSASRVEIGALLADRNRLIVEVELHEIEAPGKAVVRPPGREHLPGGLFGEVRLEIHPE